MQHFQLVKTLCTCSQSRLALHPAHPRSLFSYQNRKGEEGIGKRAQSGKCLPCKHKGLEFDSPEPTFQKARHGSMHLESQQWGGRDWRNLVPGALCSASPLGKFHASERLCLQNKMNGTQPPHTCMQPFGRMRVHTVEWRGWRVLTESNVYLTARAT